MNSEEEYPMRITIKSDGGILYGSDGYRYKATWIADTTLYGLLPGNVIIRVSPGQTIPECRGALFGKLGERLEHDFWNIDVKEASVSLLTHLTGEPPEYGDDFVDDKVVVDWFPHPREVAKIRFKRLPGYRRKIPTDKESPVASLI